MRRKVMKNEEFGDVDGDDFNEDGDDAPLLFVSQRECSRNGIVSEYDYVWDDSTLSFQETQKTPPCWNEDLLEVLA